MHWRVLGESGCPVVWLGTSLKEQGFTKEVKPQHYFVKEAVFPFAKFPKVDPILGPEMKSTGEVMGVGATFAEAFGKASLGAGEKLPETGTAFISVREVDKPGVCGSGSHVDRARLSAWLPPKAPPRCWVRLVLR